MNKHVIIAGCTRAGKTTLSRKLRSEGFNHYKMDTIKRGIENNFVEGRYEWWSDVSLKMAKLIKKIVDESRTDLTLEDNIVIDTCHVYPKDLASQNMENVIIVVLGYPNITPKEKLKQIRANDKEFMWTTKQSDDFFIKWSPLDIEYSIEAEKQCKEYNIPFYDTGSNFDKALDDAYKYIKSKLEEK